VIGDSATADVELKKSVGPEDGALLDYREEPGKPFKVKLGRGAARRGFSV